MIKTEGLNNTTLRMQNRGLILKLICSGECSSRIELARETGLSKMAVTNIVNDFIDEGILFETHSRHIQGKGRNPVMLDISPSAPKVMGVHISGRICGVSLCDLKLNTLENDGFKITEENKDKIFDNIFEIIDTFLEKHKGEKVLGIGIGAPGLVYGGEGILINATDLFGMKEVEVTDIFEKRYDLPVFFEHEYDCAAMTECFYGEGRKLGEFLFIGISDRVGSGAVTNNKLRRSINGITSEFGHMCINFNGEKCSCGRRGCLETYLSITKVTEKLRKATGEDLTFKEFCERYKDGAPENVENIFEETCKWISGGIINTVNLTCIVNYIIGHEGCYVPDRFVKLSEEMVNERILFRNHRKVKIIKTKLHDEVLSRSCACAVLEKLFLGYAYELVSY